MRTHQPSRALRAAGGAAILLTAAAAATLAQARPAPATRAADPQDTTTLQRR